MRNELLRGKCALNKDAARAHKDRRLGAEHHHCHQDNRRNQRKRRARNQPHLRVPAYHCQEHEKREVGKVGGSNMQDSSNQSTGPGHTKQHNGQTRLAGQSPELWFTAQSSLVVPFIGRKTKFP
jgi:hypothetical protein